MRPLTDIRRDNLRQLIVEFGGDPGGQANLARHVDKDRRQISAWAADPSKPGAKNLSTRVAREIELACGKPPYWMDYDNTESPLTAGVNSPITSQPRRTDRVKMRDAMTLLSHLADLQGAPELVHDPDAIAIAYDFLVEFDTPLGESNVLDITKRIAEKIRGEASAATERSKTA